MRKRKGFTLVEIMVVVFIIALLSVFAIPNLLRARITANESVVQAGLKILSTCIETYAAVNDGNYAPADNTTTDTYLRTAAPPYLNKVYCAQTLNGYTYTCDIDLAAYSITATASSCGITGNSNFTITTGGILSSPVACR